MSTPPTGPQDQPSFPPPGDNPPSSFPTPPADPAGSFPPPPAPSQYSPPPPQYAPAPPQYGAPVPQYGAPGQVAGGVYQDAESGLLIPTGTTLASRGRRIGAYFLAIPLSIITLGIGYLIWGLVVWGKGTTPALQVLGMRVWRPADQKTATWGIMALREIVGGIVEGILSIITLLISFILFLTGRERKALHDIIAGTIVLHDPNKVLG